MAMANKAAWLTAAKMKPFEIAEAPMPEPRAGEIVIRNHAAAINPADAIVQELGILVEKYPAILGCDVAGEVTAVGANVNGFKVGERVAAVTDGIMTSRNTNCGFQLYVAMSERGVTKLPDSISYAQGSVLPLAISTAMEALFQQHTLALNPPQLENRPSGKTGIVLVWGASSSVGCCAIQMIKAAGYEVAAVASTRNHDFCKDLGANYVFDYANETVVDDIVQALQGKAFAGAFAAMAQAPDTVVKCGHIVSRLDGRKFLATTYPPGMPMPEGVPDDVKTSSANSMAVIEPDSAVGHHVWGGWIPAALRSGALQCKPEPYVVGKGLEYVQTACDKLREGVSATKLVVELP